MKHYLKLYWLFNKNKLKETLQNKSGLILFFVAKILRFVFFFLFVFNLLSHTKFLAGYTFNQTVIFFITFNLIDSLAQVLFREVYLFRPLVVSGELDAILIKPHPPLLRVLLGGVDFLDILMSIPLILLLIFFTSKIGGITFPHVLTYVFLIANALTIAMSFHILVLALGILTTEVDHAVMVYRDFTRMASLPIDIYKEPLRSILTFVIPVGVMITVPVKALFGVLTPPVLLISFTIAVVSLIISLSLWNKALKQYQSWGG